MAKFDGTDMAGDIHYFFGGSTAGEVVMRFEEPKFPTGTGTAVSIDSNGYLVKAVSALKYKDVDDTNPIPASLFNNLEIKQWTLKKDEKKITRVGPIADDVDNIAGEFSDSFVIKNKEGEVEAIFDISLLYQIVREQRAMIEDLKFRVATLEGAQI